MVRDFRLTIAAVWRVEAAKVIGAVARMVRDMGLAEELAQDALVSALEHSPKDGIPDNTAAWLIAAAKNGALDGRDTFGDDLLRLVFAACAPRA